MDVDIEMTTTSLGNKIFDRRQVRRSRERAVSLISPFDFLHKDLEGKLIERCRELKKQFSKILIIGSKTTQFEKNLSGELCFYDFNVRSHQYMSVVGDEEYLPFKEAQFDLIISSAHLHHVNDLKGCLYQFHHILKPGGMILGAVIGEMSLHQLRRHIIMQELKKEIGNAPRLSPMLELKTMAQLLVAAGFNDPVCDLESYSLEYSRLSLFVEDLRQMGETNMLEKRKRGLSCPQLRDIFEDSVPIDLEYIFFASLKST